MYARVVTATFKPDMIARGLLALHDAVRPHVSKQPGFRTWEVLADRRTGFTQTTTHWATEGAARDAAKASFQEGARMLDGLLEGTATQAIYEVVR